MASKNKNPSVTVVTTPFIISYPKLLTPAPFKDPDTGQEKGDPVYSFEGISAIDSLDWSILDREKDEFVTGNIEKRLVKLAKEKFGADYDVRAAVAAEGLSWPFKSGDKKADAKGAKADHYRGKKFWRAKAMAEINGQVNEPTLYEAAPDGSLVRLIKGTEAGKARINELFYGGAICTAELNFVAGDTNGKYVTAYTNSVIFEKDGERLGGGSAVEKLRGVRGGKTSYDPTEGMSDELEDEIPF